MTKFTNNKSSIDTPTLLTASATINDVGGSFLFNKDSECILGRFYACQEEKVEFGYDITDNYVEDNSAVHDHIGVRPILFNLRGKVGDVAYPLFDNAAAIRLAELQGQTLAAQTTVRQTIAAALTPTMSNYMSVAIGAYYSVADNVKGAVGTLKKLGVMAANTTSISTALSKTKAGAKALKGLKSLAATNTSSGQYTGERVNPQIARLVVEHILSYSQTPLTLVCDMGEFDNMYITNAYVAQNESRYTGDVVVELKQLRAVSTQLTKVDYEQYSERYAQQRSFEQDAGNIQGQKGLVSTLYKETYGDE